MIYKVRKTESVEFYIRGDNEEEIKQCLEITTIKDIVDESKDFGNLEVEKSYELITPVMDNSDYDIDADVFLGIPF